MRNQTMGVSYVPLRVCTGCRQTFSSSSSDLLQVAERQVASRGIAARRRRIFFSRHACAAVTCLCPCPCARVSVSVSVCPRVCVQMCVRAAAASFMVKDKRMPMMNEIVDVLESITEDVEEWVVPKAPELKPDEENALKEMAEKARLMVEDMKKDPEKVRARV